MSLLTAACTSVSGAVAAQQPNALTEAPSGVIVLAEPLDRPSPSYPSRALSQRREGWARASFIISEEGDVIEPMIEESSHPDFDAPTLRAIQRWRFKPATLEGQPIEQSMVETIIRYNLTESAGASRKFIQQYRGISSLLTSRAFVEADALLKPLEQGELNLYEAAWLGWLQYVRLEAEGTASRDALMVTLRRALGSSDNDYDNYLEPDMFVLASQRMFTLAVREGQLSTAVGVLERLEASKSAKRSDLYEDVMAPLRAVRLDIMKVVARPEVLQQVAQVDRNRYWVNRLLRRSFAFGDVRQGELELVDLRCTRANRRLPAVPNAVLRIPVSWGDCRVYIKGDEGTTFVFEEYAEEGGSVDVPPPP